MTFLEKKLNMMQCHVTQDYVNLNHVTIIHVLLHHKIYVTSNHIMLRYYMSC